MSTPQEEPLNSAPQPSESLEASVRGMLNMFDPATAIYELERLDEAEYQPLESAPEPAPPAPAPAPPRD